MTFFVMCCLFLADEPVKTPKNAPEPPAVVKKATAPTPQENEKRPEDSAKPTDVFLRHFDRNGDGLLSPAELPWKFAKKFGKTDANRDGFLDRREILRSNSEIGQNARSMEDLKLDRNGRFERRGRVGETVAAIGIGILRRIDRNEDGYVDSRELKDVTKEPGIVVDPLLELAQLALGTVASEESATPPQIKKRPAANGDVKPTESTKSSSIGPDGLPSAEAILENLDKNENGVLERTEAVDRLAENFDRLDLDRSGSLNKKEIETGLRLARLLGLGPMSDPRLYRAAPPETQTPQPPASEAKKSAKKGGYL